MSDTNSNNWASDIDRAMREIDNRQPEIVTNTSHINIPPAGLYIGGVILIIALVMNWSAIIQPHASPDNRNYLTGPRVSLLMTAEDIENYRRTHKSLPDNIPGSLGQILNMKYEKIDSDKFILELEAGGATLQLIDDNRSISFKSI